MPNDVYQWEAAGGLVHHCPQCFKPLTTPQSRSRCLGEHVEWCPQYHTQLFKKGTSSQCDPCHRSDEERMKRHREIAEKIHELKQLKADQAPASPLTPKAINILSREDDYSPMTKKDRKAAKKLKKVAEMPKVVSTIEVEAVRQVLYPPDSEIDELEIERQLVEDPDIKLNRFYHKGTGNKREIRYEFVMKDRRSSKTEMHVDPDQIDGLLQLLNVAPCTTTASAVEKTVVAELRKKIEDDLIHTQKENEAKMMRKAGFWRWASKKAHKRLVQNGRIWSDKDHDSAKSKAGSSSVNSSSSTGAGAEIDADTDITEPDTEPDTDITTPSGDEVVETFAQVKINDTDSYSAAVDTPKTLDDGWTKIGKASKKVKTPVGNLKLMHNGGLARLAASPSPSRRGFCVSTFGFDSEL